MQDVTTAERDERADWIRWLDFYGAGAFYDAFLRDAQGAESTCTQCGSLIYLDIREGGGIADWQTRRGDYGCNESPDTTEDGVGSHLPRKLDI